MKDDFKRIKKLYGEKFAQMCRSKFGYVMEREDVSLADFLSQRFAPNKDFYNDLDTLSELGNFIDFVNGFFTERKEHVEIKETPQELMKKAGYTLIECKNPGHVKKFEKYYEEDELLCTFNEIEERLDEYYVFWAVKDNVRKIKRKDFPNPEREDEYGTSVISIQFHKGKYNSISIKNRYNHSVKYCDHTFSNDLDNIYPGLTASFMQHYGFNPYGSDEEFELNGHTRDNKGVMHKYNRFINNMYYCDNNVIITRRGDAIQLDKAQYVLADYFVFDMKNKTVKLFDPNLQDSFVRQFLNIEKINVGFNDNGEKVISVHQENKEVVEIVLDNNNRIVKLRNANITRIGDKFMHRCGSLQEIDLPNVEKAGNNCLSYTSLSVIKMPKLVVAGSCFMSSLHGVKEIDLSSLEELGDYCFVSVEGIEKLSFKNLKSVGDNFCENSDVVEIDFPNLEHIGTDCFDSCDCLQRVNLQSLDKEQLMNLPAIIVKLNKKAERLQNLKRIFHKDEDLNL